LDVKKGSGPWCLYLLRREEGGKKRTPCCFLIKQSRLPSRGRALKGGKLWGRGDKVSGFSLVAGGTHRVPTRSQKKNCFVKKRRGQHRNLTALGGNRWFCFPGTEGIFVNVWEGTSGCPVGRERATLLPLIRTGGGREITSPKKPSTSWFLDDVKKMKGRGHIYFGSEEQG